MQPIEQAHNDPQWIEYAEFGERFVAHAVTTDRIEAAVAGIAGKGMKFGPFSVGPAGLAGLVAEGKVGGRWWSAAARTSPSRCGFRSRCR